MVMNPIDAAVPANANFRGNGGLELKADVWGDPKAQPVLLLHGGGQTRHAWGGTCAELAREGMRAIAIDARGHGESAWDDAGDYRFETFARDLLEVLDQLEQKPAVVGASLGGMMGLIAEGLMRPGSLKALVLVDVTPRFNARGVERILDFMRSKPEGFASLEEAAEAVAAYQPHRRRPKDASGLRKNLRRGKDGRYRWHWDPRMMEARNFGEGPERAPKLEEAAANLTLPTLLVRGKLSDVVEMSAVDAFRGQVPQAEFVDVSGAGHMVAGDSNDVFTDAVVAFLKRHL